MGAGTTYDGSTRLYWFADDDTPTDLEAITLVELTDAVDLSGYLVSFNPNFSDSRVDGKDWLTSHDNESIGRFGTKPVGEFKRKLADDDAELAWTTFATRKARGTLVYFNTLPDETDPTTGDDYIAIRCQHGSRQQRELAANTEVRFGIEFAVFTAPVDGTLVAS